MKPVPKLLYLFFAGILEKNPTDQVWKFISTLQSAAAVGGISLAIQYCDELAAETDSSEFRRWIKSVSGGLEAIAVRERLRSG